MTQLFVLVQMALFPKTISSKAGTEERAVDVLGHDHLEIRASAVEEAGRIWRPGSEAGLEDIMTSPDIEGREEEEEAGF